MELFCDLKMAVSKVIQDGWQTLMQYQWPTIENHQGVKSQSEIISWLTNWTPYPWTSHSSVGENCNYPHCSIVSEARTSTLPPDGCFIILQQWLYQLNLGKQWSWHNKWTTLIHFKYFHAVVYCMLAYVEIQPKQLCYICITWDNKEKTEDYLL